MDRNTLVAYILIFLIFFGFYYFTDQNIQDLNEQQSASDTTEIVTQDTLQSTLAEQPVSIIEEDSTLDAGDTIEAIEEEVITLSNQVLKIDVTTKGGHVKRAELLEYKRYDSSELVLFDDAQHHFGFEVPLKSSSFYTNDLDYKVTEKTDTSLVLASLNTPVSVVHSYTISDGYTVDYNFYIDGQRAKLSSNNPYITLNWDQKIQSQEKSISGERDASDIYYKYKSSSPDNLGATDSEEDELKTELQWITFKQKFFNSALIFDEVSTDDGTEVEIIEPEDDDFDKFVEEHRAEIPFEMPRTGNPNLEFTMYFGPNHYQTLKKLDNELEEIIPLGWSIFAWVNKLAVIPIFNWLNNFISNYGLIIFLMTLIIKGVLFVPMYKVYVSTAKMRLLKPELDELKAKHGDNMTAMQQDQMKLYKQAGVNPFGGCLPQLVQLPILIAMFRFFPSSIELRQQPLWWADDLSTYDSIMNLPFEIPFYGDHVSLFTLLMTAVTLIYTSMNSQMSGANNPSMKMVMYIMPIMFLGFFNNYAAALSYYYLLSTSITIVQNFVIRRFIIDEDKLHAQIQANKKKKVKVKKSGLLQRLEENAKKRGIDPQTGRRK
jgi:YidC/Oxa1 family membrane protein insertase